MCDRWGAQQQTNLELALNFLEKGVGNLLGVVGAADGEVAHARLNGITDGGRKMNVTDYTAAALLLEDDVRVARFQGTPGGRLVS